MGKAAREPTKLPVLVFIHGESYEWNAGNPYDGTILATVGNVVVVTINYRLGILGFLPATEGSARGNYGLMDQVAALHWIQENIVEFGGDSKNVTIVGQGHGAAFVNLLMISPMAKGLFHRAIMQSGSALSPWAIAREALTYGNNVARILACPVQDSASMLDCMRLRPLEEIMRIQLVIPDHTSAFGPTVDGIVIPFDPLIPMQEKESLFGRYDLMFGVTRIENYFHLSAQEEKHGIDPERRDRLLRTLVRNLFNYHMQEIFLTIVNEYTDWTRPVQHPVNILDSTVDALGDGLIVAPVMRAGNYHSKTHSKTYFYVFGYQSENGDYSQRSGCIHGEDLAYLFGAPLVSSLAHFARNYTRAEMTLAEAVISYWINFAKSGDPNISPQHEVYNFSSEKKGGRYERVLWQEYETVHQKYMMIGTKPKVKDHYHAHRLSFWLHLIPQLHRPGSVAVIPQHHLLEDHENPLKYDGIIRQVDVPEQLQTTVPDAFAKGILKGAPYPTMPPSGVSSLNATHSSMFGLTTGDHASLDTSQIKPTAESTANFTGARSVFINQSTYSTALSVTIAVGCSLLILNVLIFAGVYYQRDKNRMEAKLQKRNYKVRRPGERESIVIPGPQTKTTPTGASSPIPMCPPSLPPDYSHHHHIHHAPPPQQGVRMLPPKVPPKPVMVPPPGDNALPEAQPLLPQCGLQKQNAAPPITQDMPV